MSIKIIGDSAEARFRAAAEYRSKLQAAIVNDVMKASDTSERIIPNYREYLGNSKRPSSIYAVITLPNRLRIALEVDGAIHMLGIEHDKEKTKKLLAEGYDYVFRLRSGQIPKLEDESVEIVVEKNGITDAVKTLLSKLNELAEEEIFDASKVEDASVDDKYFYVDRDEIWAMKKNLCMKEMRRLHTEFLPKDYCSKDENFPIGKWLMNQRTAARSGRLSKYRYEDFLSDGIDLKEYKNKKKCH